MPVTAKLSREFYERFGDAIVNEMVDWFNTVDATYKADLRELNELNFSRFDSSMQQRMAELRAVLRSEVADLRAELRSEIAELRAELRSEIADLRVQLQSETADLRVALAPMATKSELEEARTSLERRFDRQTRWLTGVILGWTTLIAVIFALVTG